MMYFETDKAERINETTKQKAETNLKKKNSENKIFLFLFWALHFGSYAMGVASYSN